MLPHTAISVGSFEGDKEKEMANVFACAECIHGSEDVANNDKIEVYKTYGKWSFFVGHVHLK